MSDEKTECSLLVTIRGHKFEMSRQEAVDLIAQLSMVTGYSPPPLWQIQTPPYKLPTETPRDWYQPDPGNWCHPDAVRLPLTIPLEARIPGERF